MLGHEKTPWERLLPVAQLLDYLERDFKDVYTGQEPTLSDGYEATLKKMFDDKFKGK